MCKKVLYFANKQKSSYVGHKISFNQRAGYVSKLKKTLIIPIGCKSFIKMYIVRTNSRKRLQAI